MLTGVNWYLEAKNYPQEELLEVFHNTTRDQYASFCHDNAPINAPGKSYWVCNIRGYTAMDFAVSTKTLTKKDMGMVLMLCLVKYGMNLPEETQRTTTIGDKSSTVKYLTDDLISSIVTQTKKESKP